MGNSKNIGSAFENEFKHLCQLQGIAITQVYDGFIRIGAGGLLPKKQACDFILSFNGRSALIDCKTQLAGQTFDKSNVDQDQIDKMRPHHRQGTRTGYVVFFRNEQKLVFFDSWLLEQDKRHIDDGVYLGELTNCDLKKIFICETPKLQLQSP